MVTRTHLMWPLFFIILNNFSVLWKEKKTEYNIKIYIQTLRQKLTAPGTRKLE
jgi:hypothetical protein